MTTALRAIDIAKWFVAWADNIDAYLSNLKVQNLLYYAQGAHLAETGRPLFADPVEAWARGPVVADVYRMLRHYGNSPIEPDAMLGEDFDWERFKSVEALLLRTWNTYGSVAAWALRDRTYRESPWREAFEETNNRVITVARLERFFRGQAR
jgi:uncharacterized phage-associated protein